MTKKASKKAVSKPKLLSGGNPQIAMGYGDEIVQSYIKAMPDWKQNIGRKIDKLVSKAVPKVMKAVKWNTPLYGMEENHYFLSFHCFNKYVKVGFLNGGSLKPRPPGESKHKTVRYLDIYEDDSIDEAQLTAWFKQASKLPGEKM